MTDTQTTRTIAEIVDTIDLAKLPPYRLELVYVHGNDDGLDAKTVETLLREGWDDSVDEWISEAQWVNACDLAHELFEEACEDDEFEALEAGWGSSDERVELIYSIQECDTSNPYRDLLSNTGHMLFRVQPDEDDMVWIDAERIVDAWDVCDAVGLGEEWRQAVEEIQPEIEGYAAEGGGYFGATLVFRASPADLYGHAEDTQVEISEPFLWLTNPWAGNGYGVVATGVTATVKMADIHTDKAAWGYGADDVFGGLLLDDSDITIKQEATT